MCLVNHPVNIWVENAVPPKFSLENNDAKEHVHSKDGGESHVALRSSRDRTGPLRWRQWDTAANKTCGAKGVKDHLGDESLLKASL